MAMPVPRGFLTPKKPQAALKLEEKQRQAALRDPHPASQSVQPGVSEGVADGATQLSADSMSAFMRAAPSQAAGTNTFSSLTTLNEVETVQISAKPESPPLIEALEQGHADLRPVSTWDRERERDGDRDLRYSVTDASSPPRTHLAELSSDDLVRPSNADFAEKNLVNGRAHGHSSHPLRSSFVVKRASVGRKGSGSPEGQKTAPTSYRRYTHFENSLQSWFCGGHLMSGGDNLFSFAMTLVLLLGITGVWIGTTGVWLWHHGREYGLTRGGGVAVVIIFV
jgi:palmitoyltransferase ZDHHC9/14/18